MDLASRRRLVRLYEQSLRRHGPTVRALRWNSEHSQRTRFAVLLEVTAPSDWEGASLADVGCGLGDLYGYLQEWGRTVDYVGYDLVPAMVAAARQKYPGACFAVRDILEEGLGRPFDYVLASGTFNIRVAHHDRFLRQAIAVMYAGCRQAVAFNLLSPSPFQAFAGNEMYYEVEPEEVLAFCRTLCDRVELRQGYLWGDFTVYMYQERETKQPEPEQGPTWGA